MGNITRTVKMNMGLAYISQFFQTPRCNLAARAVAEAHPECHVRALRGETMSPGKLV